MVVALPWQMYCSTATKGVLETNKPDDPDLRSTYATRLSARGVADEWVTQLLRQGDAQAVQEVPADEASDEAGGAEEDQPDTNEGHLGFDTERAN